MSFSSTIDLFVQFQCTFYLLYGFIIVLFSAVEYDVLYSTEVVSSIIKAMKVKFINNYSTEKYMEVIIRKCD